MRTSRLSRIGKIILGEFALLTTELAAILILGLLAIVSFVKLSLLVVTDRVDAFDQMIISRIQGLYSEDMTRFMKAVTNLAMPSYVIIPVLLIVLYFLFIKPHRWYAIKFPAIALGSYLMNVLLKVIFDRPRPQLDQRMVEALQNLSFPSGHAMFAISFYGMVILMIWKLSRTDLTKAITLLFFGSLIFLIGFSRIYLKVHYPSDVLAGFAAGFIWLLISVFLINAIERIIKSREKKNLKVQLDHIK